jgi:hypothetical protein
MSEKEPTDTSSADRLAETGAAYATRRVADLTVAELRDLLRQVVREAQRPAVRIDDKGYLVFPDQASYVAYLDAHPDKYPSELNAYYIDRHGFKTFYSDYEPTPEKARELEEIRREIAEGQVVDAEAVFKELGL